MATRTQVRTAVVQMLYAIDLGNEDMKSQISEYLEERKIKGTKAKWGEELFGGVLEHLEKIDEVIKNHLSKEWDFDRLDNVDRAILRLGVYEELFTDLPYQVVINEAVEIAKLLSNENSTKFINGMLDKIAKEKNETVHSS
jgi:N utilization substance protein B